MLIIAHLLLENMEEIPGYFGHFVETFKNVFENMQYQNCQGFAFIKRLLTIGMKNWGTVPQTMWDFLLGIFYLYSTYPESDPMEPHQYYNFSSCLLIMLDVLQHEQARENIPMKDKEEILVDCQNCLGLLEDYPLIQGRMINMILTIKLEQGKAVEPQLITEIVACAKGKGFWTYDSCLLLHLLAKMLDLIPKEEQYNLLYILIYVLRWEKERMTNQYIQRF